MNPHLDELISLVSHPAIQGRRGKWKDTDMFYTEDDIYYDGPQIYPKQYNTRPPDGSIWVPHLSDPIQPERGLIGMTQCDGGGYSLVLKCCEPKEWSIDFIKLDGQYISQRGPTPEIAVAKAVIAQWTDERSGANNYWLGCGEDLRKETK